MSLRIFLPCIAALLLGALPAGAQDIRTIKNEQDVLELQGQVRTLERRIEALENELKLRPPPGVTPGNAKSATAVDPNARWLDEANWAKVQAGLGELDVIRILGVPNAVRRATDNSTHTLLYALETSSGNFLSGTVTIAAQRVVSVQKPSLK